MKKKTITVEVDHKIGDRYNGKYGFEMPIDDLISSLNEAKNKGAEDFCLETSAEYGSAYVYISFTYDRLETDEELSDRLTEEAIETVNNRDRELKQLERLKHKYET